LTDEAGHYQAELDALQRMLGAPRSDLEALLQPALAKQVSVNQVSDLLGQSWARLKELRQLGKDDWGVAWKDPKIAAALAKANHFLQPGDTFSLDKASNALAKAYARAVESGEASLNLAHIRAGEALLGALLQEYPRAAKFYAQAAVLPGLDLSLQWRYQSRRALILADLGREFMDNAALEECIHIYQDTVLTLVPKIQKPLDWATTQNDIGNALGVLGQRRRGTRMLEESIIAFENALSERSRQNNLGNTLGILGQRQNNTEMLEKSLQAFECALEVRTQENSPREWATTQNNLGSVLQALGQRKNDAQLLKRSVEAYKQVLLQWTRDQVPLHWAATLNNLGTALRMLGEHRKSPRTLEKSVAAYRNALAERTRERVPQDWAMTQNNLGAALQKLGEREENTQILEHAIAAYENALKEWTHEQMPMAWAMTMANLAVAQKTLAQRLNDVGLARVALSGFEAVAQVFRSASHAQYYEFATEQVAKTQKILKELDGD
jgi:tetratricopeptide (TPR) repeat protein